MNKEKLRTMRRRKGERRDKGNMNRDDKLKTMRRRRGERRDKGNTNEKLCPMRRIRRGRRGNDTNDDQARRTKKQEER